MLAIANDSTKDLMAQATETDGIAICCKAIENMPVVDAEKVKVKLDNQTNGNVMLYTNGDSLLLMLSYILENAVKFTEEGHIILKVRTEKQKGRKMMLFSVEDTGCGIPSDKVGVHGRTWTRTGLLLGVGTETGWCPHTRPDFGGRHDLHARAASGENK